MYLGKLHTRILGFSPYYLTPHAATAPQTSTEATTGKKNFQNLSVSPLR
jgi:hypothetical protein